MTEKQLISWLIENDYPHTAKRIEEKLYDAVESFTREPPKTEKIRKRNEMLIRFFRQRKLKLINVKTRTA
jgi:hypothetical protein